MKLLDHWFYGSTPLGDDGYSFSPEETTHATNALRLGEGDGIQWLDGKGGRYVGVLTKVKRSGMVAEIRSKTVEAAKAPVRLSVGILHDQARLEWLVEKAVELGVSRIDLLQTARVQPSRYKQSRLESKAVAALKQSGGAYLPAIEKGNISDLFLSSGGRLSPKPGAPAPLFRVIAHCYSDLPRARFGTAASEEAFGTWDSETLGLHLVIGPEGDFTQEEVASAEAAGFTAVSLGEARLRTETAAIAALAAWALR